MEVGKMYKQPILFSEVSKKCFWNNIAFVKTKRLWTYKAKYPHLYLNFAKTNFFLTDTCCHEIDPNLQVRFRGSTNPNEGYVEVKYNNQVWKGVCDDKFDLNDAHVLCRMAGFYDGASAYYQGSKPFGYGPSVNDFVVDDLECTGTELTITRCKPIDWNVHNCGSGEWAGVQCSGEKTQDCG